MSFETPSQLSEKKPSFDLEGLSVRLEANTENPSFNEKCSSLYEKYGEKMRRPMIALVTALVLSFESYPVSAQEQDAFPEPQAQSAENPSIKSEKVEMTAEDYKALSPEERVDESNKHSEGVKNAIDTNDKALFEFHLGEIEKIAATIEDEVQRANVQSKISTYKKFGKMYFFFYGKE